MPTKNNDEYTFTGTLLNGGEDETKKEVHIHIENLESLDLHIQM